MSIATKQQQREGAERSSKQSTDQQHSPSNSSNKWRQQYEGKSIVTPTRHSKQTPTADIHVTKKSKSLTKQTPVVASTDSGEIGGGGGDELAKEGNIESDEALESYSDIYETPPDYRIYQEGKLQEFFKDASTGIEIQRPKTVSDVCLVNDHYILVKMPTSTPETAKTEVKFCHAANDAQRSNRKLCRYLGSKGNRIRKINPISEEPEYVEDSGVAEEPQKSQSSKSRRCLSVNACWQAPDEEVEVYHTHTTIRQTPIQPITTVREAECRADISSRSTGKEEPRVQVNHKPHEVQSISGTIITSSLQDRVTLRSYGSLVGNNSVDISHCRKSCTPQRRKCLRFERFHWLLRPFRGSKYRKPKPKIQAVVYKSYFVKWTQPPETRHHGFGSVKLTEMGSSVLRRCRSAIF